MGPKTTLSSPTEQHPPDPSAAVRPLAIVIPWFGRSHHGGAEMHAWQLATRLAQRGRLVEVLTTCCRSYQDDWGVNHLPAGVSHEPEGFSIRRFPVEPRNREAFDTVNGKLLALSKEELKAGISPIPADECTIFIDELIKSSALLEFLRSEADSYHAFLFLPYLYGTTLRGLPRVARKAFLQPCLHHEAYAFLPQVFEAFFLARNVLYLSDGEAELATRIYGPGIIPKSITTGAGVIPSEIPEDRSILEHLGGSPFILCLGRQDKGKNTDMLAHAYATFRASNPASDLCLVLAGPGQLPLPKCCGLYNVGAVSEGQKNALLAHCKALFHPSQNESYSRVIMEAWRNGRPTAAHASCLATATAVTRAGGGWLARDQDEWVRLFSEIAKTPSEQLSLLGASGRRYAESMADWEKVIDAYEAVLWKPTPAAPVLDRPSIHQVLPNFVYGDAISNHARTLRDMLRTMGHPSEIYSLDTAKDVAHETLPFTPECLRASDAVIYHHSIGTAVTHSVANHSGVKCLIYHNITPHEFFAPYLPIHERLCREGRANLPDLARHFPISVGDSRFNAAELEAVGFASPGVLPIVVDPSKWSITPDPTILKQLSDGRTNLLFVGRIVPNKRQEDLIAAFASYRKLDSAARLILVGGTVSPDDLYQECLQELAFRLGVANHVVFTGPVSDAELCAYYRSADLFWSMSEHEGFCVPLVEAMWFDIPVFAYDCSAVGETLASSAVLFKNKDDLPRLARLAFDLVTDPSRRLAIIAAQRQRRTAFTIPRVKGDLVRIVDAISPSAPRLNASEQAKPRVALVVQRCGKEVNGGAESLCLQIAEQMAQIWDTEVLTTCALDYMTWANHFPAVTTSYDKTLIRRFPVSEQRNVEAFDRLSSHLVTRLKSCSIEEQITWMHAQGPNCPSLSTYIRDNRERYDAFLFFGYLYATTFDNLPLVADKAWLVPCAHDEWPLHFTMFDQLFSQARGLIFNTAAERSFVQERFAHLRTAGPIAGAGIEAPLDIRPERFRSKFEIKEPFLLYCGRIDASKGCSEMFDAFVSWKNSGYIRHKLVLIGKAVLTVPKHPDIIHLGFVSESDKWDAMAGCDWLLMPSLYESLSLALLEAWAVGRPALVNAKSPVLVDHCTRSHGGIAFQNWDQARDAIKAISAAETEILGKNGQRYVAQDYSWNKVRAKYSLAIAS